MLTVGLLLQMWKWYSVDQGVSPRMTLVRRSLARCSSPALRYLLVWTSRQPMDGQTLDLMRACSRMVRLWSKSSKLGYAMMDDLWPVEH